LLLQLATERTSVLAVFGPVLLALATVVDNVVVAHDVPGMTARPENARTPTMPSFKPFLFLILPPSFSGPGNVR
jgi:hypothetical protein